MTIVGNQNFLKHIAAHRVDNPDVTGAGDTVIAALFILKQKMILNQLRLHNAAPAIVVGKKGTASVTIDEINNYI